MGLVGEALAQGPQQPRLADPGLAREQHHLTVALARPEPALHQDRELVGAPDQRRDVAAAKRLEAAFGAALPADLEHRDRFGEPLERLGPEVGQREQAADQAPGARGDHHRAGFGERLEPRREVRGLAEHRLLLRGALPDELAHQHLAGRDADPRRERHVAADGELGDRFGQLQTGTHGALGIVLVRARKAEVGEHPVAQEAGDVPAPALHDLAAAVAVGAHQRAHVLGIEAAGERGRADEVAEQHRQMAALGAARALARSGCRGRLGRAKSMAALGAEPGVRHGRRAAGGTAGDQGCAAGDAEPARRRRLAAVRALHPTPSVRRHRRHRRSLV